MFTGLIEWSLRNRLMVLLAALGFVGLGWFSLQHLNIDAFPDTTPAQVQINTVAPGLGPLEVESQITFPIEQAVSGLPAQQQVRSLSKFGLSQVVVAWVRLVRVTGRPSAWPAAQRTPTASHPG
jgi:cobalt-zinc-cadmium resistance protein CzcA